MTTRETRKHTYGGAEGGSMYAESIAEDSSVPVLWASNRGQYFGSTKIETVPK